MEINPEVLQRTGRLAQNAADYLNALEIDEIFDERIEFQPAASGLGGSIFLEFSKVKPQAPQFLAFTRVLLDGDEVLTALPTFGFSAFNGTKITLNEYTVAFAFKNGISIQSLTTAPFTDPIQVLIYVLKDKSGSDRIQSQKLDT